MKKRFNHRGYSVESNGGLYTTFIAGKRITGTLLGVKQSIDWWCETNILRKPSEFDKQEFNTEAQKKVEIYKGLKIFNDSEDPRIWYMVVRGRLIKGPLAKIKLLIDQKLSPQL